MLFVKFFDYNLRHSQLATRQPVQNEFKRQLFKRKMPTVAKFAEALVDPAGP
jgi:hypothetical protein